MKPIQRHTGNVLSMVMLLTALTLLNGCETGVKGAAAAATQTVRFIQQETVQSFDVATGSGLDIGTAVGTISGTTVVEIHFSPSGPTAGNMVPITFSNKVTITDIDGDQVFFDSNGTGTFHVIAQGATFSGTGGPLTGTYVLTGGTGKYQSWTAGSTYQYRAIRTGPTASTFGTAYAEIHE